MKVSLDGLDVEVTNDLEPEEAAERLKSAASELAQTWSRWNVRVEDDGDGLRVAGEKRGKAKFVARLASEPGLVTAKIAGSIELSLIELAAVGGERGVRARVKLEVASILREKLEAR